MIQRLTEAEFKRLFKKNNKSIPKKRKKEEDALQQECENHLILKGIQAIHLTTFIKRRCSCGKWNCYSIKGNKGVADLIVLTDNGAIFTELKSLKGYLSSSQKRFRDRLPKIFKFYVIKKLEDFKKLFT